MPPSDNSPLFAQRIQAVHELYRSILKLDASTAHAWLAVYPDALDEPEFEGLALDICRHSDEDTLRFALDLGLALPQNVLFEAWSSEKFRLIVARGGDIKAVASHAGSNHWTLLHDAAYRHSADIVDLLLLKGADPFIKAGDGDYLCKDMNAMQVAAKTAAKDKVEKINLFLGAGLPLDVHTACSMGYVFELQHMIQENPDVVNERDGYESTPLHTAVTSKQVEAVRLHLSHGADVNAMNSKGVTPLLLGAISANDELIDLLSKGDLPLDIFACGALGQVEEIERIVSADPAALTIADQNGLTALHWAARAGAIESMTRLLDLGADTEAKDNDGRTPLWSACKSAAGKPIVGFLLSKGADLNARDNAGKTVASLELGPLGAFLRAHGLKE